MNVIPEYVEVADRLYEVRICAGLLTHQGAAGKSLVDHDEQAILISDEVDPDDRGLILEKAICVALGLGLTAFRPVPVLGKIS